MHQINKYHKVQTSQSSCNTSMVAFGRGSQVPQEGPKLWGINDAILACILELLCCRKWNGKRVWNHLFFFPHWIWLCFLGSPRSFPRTFAFLSLHTRVSPEKPRAGSPRCAGLRVSQTLGISWVLKGLGFPTAQLEGKMWQVVSRFTRQRGWPCYFHRTSGPGKGKCQSGQRPLERIRLYSGTILQP